MCSNRRNSKTSCPVLARETDFFPSYSGCRVFDCGDMLLFRMYKQSKVKNRVSKRTVETQLIYQNAVFFMNTMTGLRVGMKKKWRKARNLF